MNTQINTGAPMAGREALSLQADSPVASARDPRKMHVMVNTEILAALRTACSIERVADQA